MHKEKVDPRTVAVLARATGVALFISWPGLPADTAQGITLVFRELVPLVPRGVPELMKQAVLGRNQPRQQRRVQADTLAGFGEKLFGSDKTVVPLQQRQRAIEAEDLPAKGAATGIAEAAPDFVQAHLEFIGRPAVWRVAVNQAPVQQRRIAWRQVAEHLIARLTLCAQLPGRIQVATQASATRRNIKKQFQAVEGQALQPGISPFQAQAPDTPQAVRQLLAGGVRQVHRGLFGRDGEFLTRQLTMGIKGRRYGGAGQRQACDKPSSRNRHVPTCVSLGAGFIQARTFSRVANLL